MSRGVRAWYIINSIRPLRPPNGFRPECRARWLARHSARNVTSQASPRPQSQFLGAHGRRRTLLGIRQLTTEQKAYLRYRVLLGFKWTLMSVVLLGGAYICYAELREDWLDRLHPAPDDWTFFAKHSWRRAQHQYLRVVEDRPDIDWALIGSRFRAAAAICDHGGLLTFWKAHEPLSVSDEWDKSIPGLQRILDDNTPALKTEQLSRIGMDVSGMSEPWRRAYFDALMGVAKGAEHMVDYVRDSTTSTAWAKVDVVGPSNPSPRPLPGNQKPPLEENCVRVFENPKYYYGRILSTKGFTKRQQMDAALAFAGWLDYEGDTETAHDLYTWAFDTACNAIPDADKIVDRKTFSIKSNAPYVTPNILSTTTALGSFYATHANTPKALGIYLSVLRARRAAPTAPIDKQYPLRQIDLSLSHVGSWVQFISALPWAPEYPPAPPSGDEPFERSRVVACEEAGLMAFVGEIIFAGGATREGLSWTRDAVDMANDGYLDTRIDAPSRRACIQCLTTGYANWEDMVRVLAREEGEKGMLRQLRPGEQGKWWWALWSRGWNGSKEAGVEGQWEAEVEVVERRRERFAQERVVDMLNQARLRSRSGFGM